MQLDEDDDLVCIQWRYHHSCFTRRLLWNSKVHQPVCPDNLAYPWAFFTKSAPGGKGWLLISAEQCLHGPHVRYQGRKAGPGPSPLPRKVKSGCGLAESVICKALCERHRCALPLLFGDLLPSWGHSVLKAKLCCHVRRKITNQPAVTL